MLFVLKTLGLFLVTAVAEIVGCYLPYLWLKATNVGMGVSSGSVKPRGLRLAAFSALGGGRPDLRRLRWGLCFGRAYVALVN
jgi:drug/metabolite transporter superfamily protein YnfA